MYTAKGQLDRDALIRQHVPLVRRIAHHMIAKLPPNVELDDLIQVGMMGLAEALSRYETAQGVQFETFASQRIRGAMLDELRESDWMSRSSRKSQKDIEQAVHRLEQKLGRSPLESEIAAEMELQPGRVPKPAEQSARHPTGVPGRHDPWRGRRRRLSGPPRCRRRARTLAELLRDQRLRASLVNAIKSLPEREQYIMGMYYEHDMNLKGNCRRARRDRIARVPTAQPVHRTPARQNAQPLTPPHRVCNRNSF